MMTVQHRRRHRWLADNAGTAAVEFALVLPTLVMFMLGIVEWGRYMYTYNTLQFGCEQAVRWGVFHITGTEAAIEDYARSQMAGITPDSVTVVIDAASNTVEVSANTQFTFLIDLVSPFPTLNLEARSKL